MNIQSRPVPEFDIYLYQGQAWVLPDFTHQTLADTPVPMDFTGYELRMHVQTPANGVLQFGTLLGSMVFISRVDGHYRMNVSQEVVDALTVADSPEYWPYYVDCFVPASSPEVTYILHRGSIVAMTEFPT